jgi:hypothetical protein
MRDLPHQVGIMTQANIYGYRRSICRSFAILCSKSSQEFKRFGYELRFSHVVSGPLTRS